MKLDAFRGYLMSLETPVLMAQGQHFGRTMEMRYKSREPRQEASRAKENTVGTYKKLG